MMLARTEPYGAGRLAMKIGKDGWLELDPQADMGEATREAWVAMKAAYEVYAAAKRGYQEAMIEQQRADGMGEAETLVFGYNFGKASVKIVKASETRAKPGKAKPTLTLAEYNAMRAADGFAN